MSGLTKLPVDFFVLLSVKEIKGEKSLRNSDCMHLSQHTLPHLLEKNRVVEWELDLTRQ